MNMQHVVKLTVNNASTKVFTIVGPHRLQLGSRTFYANPKSKKIVGNDLTTGRFVSGTFSW